MNPNKELPKDIDALQSMVKSLQEKLEEREANEYIQIDKLKRLYKQVTGQMANSNWNVSDYADAIYDFTNNIISHVPGHIFWLDINNVYLGCNEEHAKTMGLTSRHEIVGKTNKELLSAEQAEMLDQANNKVMQTGKSISLEEAADLAAGYRIFLSEKAPLRDKSGKIIGILGTAVDITDQKNTIAALEKVKNKLENSSQFKLSEIEDTYILEEKVKQLQIVNEKNEKENQRLRTILKRETTEFSSIYQQITGQVPQSRFTLRDYALAIYEYLDSVIAAAPGHIFWLDRNNVYLGCNNAQAATANLPSRQAMVGKTNYDLIWSGQAEKLNQTNNEVMESGKSLILEESIDTLDGHKIFLSEKVPLRNKQGEIIGLLGTALDITEQKHALETVELAKRKAEEASWSKSEFIQNMSHDLKTPMTTVIGMTEVLCLHEKDMAKREKLMIIKRAGQQVVDIFSHILEAASIEDGESNIKIEEISIHDIFRGILDLYLPMSEEKQLPLLFSVSRNVPETLMSDKMRIQRILVNLVGNALKFTSIGSVEVSADIEVRDSKKCLVLSIADTGVGIPQDKLEIIFEKFVRLTSSYTGKYSGTGLGLGIVKRFVEELNGDIRIESEVNKGTTFYCDIPII